MAGPPAAATTARAEAKPKSSPESSSKPRATGKIPELDRILANRSAKSKGSDPIESSMMGDGNRDTLRIPSETVSSDEQGESVDEAAISSHACNAGSKRKGGSRAKPTTKTTKGVAKHVVIVKTEPISDTKNGTRQMNATPRLDNDKAASDTANTTDATEGGNETETARLDDDTSEEHTRAKPKGQRGYATISVDEYNARQAAIEAANAIVPDGARRSSRSLAADLTRE